MSVRRGSTLATGALALAAALVVPSPAAGQAAGTGGSTPPKALTVYVRNWTRVESWRFFQPPAGTAADPDYTFVANRLQLGAERHTRRYDFVAAAQYVQFGGLPADAGAPAPLGPMGTGALYYAQGGQTAASRHLYLRYLNVRLKDLSPGWSIQAGRMAYTSGAESPSGNAKIEAVKRQRVDSKLLGEFEWSHYQRGYDGIRTDVDRKGYHVTAAVMRPTQGGFEDNAGVHIRRVNVVTGTVAVKPGPHLRHSDWETFVVRYDDSRAVAARPDNSGQAASQVDAHITTLGTMLVGAYPLSPARQMDVLVWTAWQTGDWYGQAHRAGAITVEGGVQWTSPRWKPWIRGGFTHATGDKDAADARHGTFFQVLPTVRKYSLSATYSVMNLNDGFVQILATPRPNVSLRLDVHRLSLATAADRWYYGSGATQKAGTVFGYAGRPSRGFTDLGTVAEGAVDYRFSPRWSVNGYFGVFNGGDVVKQNFTGGTRPLTFGYLEHVLQF
ncbi:MAG: alginate export family protein [Acidobacteria bacterium]|nr:alginate export family protein [Acidobacteriota bacterium]